MNEYKHTDAKDYPVILPFLKNNDFKPKIGDPFYAAKMTSEDFGSTVSTITDGRKTDVFGIPIPEGGIEIPVSNREKEFEIILKESEIKRLSDVLCVNGEAYKDIIDKLRI